jgi:hypothetical protein
MVKGLLLITGIPTAVAPGGISCRTTQLAPIFAFGPIVTGAEYLRSRSHINVPLVATNCDNCIDFAILCTIDIRLREKSMCAVMLITYLHEPDCANYAEMAG